MDLGAQDAVNQMTEHITLAHRYGIGKPLPFPPPSPSLPVPFSFTPLASSPSYCGVTEIVCYEGGADVGGGGNQTNRRLVNSDPRMTGTVQRYLEGMLASGVRLFNYYFVGMNTFSGGNDWYLPSLSPPPPLLY